MNQDPHLNTKQSSPECQMILYLSNNATCKSNSTADDFHDESFQYSLGVSIFLVHIAFAQWVETIKLLWYILGALNEFKNIITH